MVVEEVAAGTQAVVAPDALPHRAGLDEGVRTVVRGEQRRRRLVVVVARLDQEHAAVEHELLRELVGRDEILDEDVARVLDAGVVRLAQVRTVGLHEHRELLAEREAHDQAQPAEEEVGRRVVRSGDVHHLALHLAEEPDLEVQLLVLRRPLQLGARRFRGDPQGGDEEESSRRTSHPCPHRCSFRAESSRAAVLRRPHPVRGGRHEGAPVSRVLLDQQHGSCHGPKPGTGGHRGPSRSDVCIESLQMTRMAS